MSNDVITNLNCHLESADSVRTNPENRYREVHFARLFAEAFTHILLGEELKLGQTPLFDSHGMVQFLGEMLKARELYYQERKNDVVLSRFSPVVMTHYETIQRKDGTKHAFQVRENVLLETFIANTEKTSFINSALPKIGKTPDALIEYIKTHRFDIGSMPQNLYDQLETYEVSHLNSLHELDGYFRRYPNNVHRNQIARFKKLKDSVTDSLKFDFASVSEDARYVLKLYESSLDDEEFIKVVRPENGKANYGRSEVYIYLERKLEAAGRPELFAPSKEVADSLYMYNEANLADAFAETTSSGVEGYDKETIRLGEELNQLIDRVKFQSSQNTKTPDMRPVLQLVGFDASPLSDETYRSRLLRGLASFISSPSFLPLRLSRLHEIRRGNRFLQEYWQERLTAAEDHPDLKGLISWDVSHTGAYAIKFSNQKSDHVIGAIVPGADSNPDSTDQVREAIKQITAIDGKETNGNNLDLSVKSPS